MNTPGSKLPCENDCDACGACEAAEEATSSAAKPLPGQQMTSQQFEKLWGQFVDEHPGILDRPGMDSRARR